MKKTKQLICIGVLFLFISGAMEYVYRKPAPAFSPLIAGELPFINDYSMAEEYKKIVTSFQEKQEDSLACWLDGYITKDFLLGQVDRTKDSFFIKVGEEHTERERIYLLTPVYEAYKKMYEAALADGVKLIITSAHRTFIEQVCEWELRWNNPGENVSFGDDLEKARFVLQYRSMPGTSRHHWGTDIDLNSFRLAYYQTAEGKKVYAWLQENANKYGFYQPYTALGESRNSGYQEEVWHWSYLPVARFMLEKYQELVSIEDIKGFKGDQTAAYLDIIPLWVYGVDNSLLYAYK